MCSRHQKARGGMQCVSKRLQQKKKLSQKRRGPIRGNLANLETLNWSQCGEQGGQVWAPVNGEPTERESWRLHRFVVCAAVQRLKGHLVLVALVSVHFPTVRERTFLASTFQLQEPWLESFNMLDTMGYMIVKWSTFVVEWDLQLVITVRWKELGA